MVSASFLAPAAQLTQNYHPNAETARCLKSLAVTTVSGPSGIGKNTLMQASGLPMLKMWTSRPREERDETSTYLFIDNLESEGRMLADLKSGAAALPMIHPTTGHFYSVVLEALDGKGGHVLFDIIPRDYRRFRDANCFGSITAAYISAPSYESWQTRYKKRGAVDPIDLQKRLQEAQISLETAIPDPEFYFILNDDIASAAEALRIYSLTSKRTIADQTGREAAQVILRGLEAANRAA